MIYLDLFLGFLKVGCFAFGGAYGAIPLIRDVVLSYGWLSDEMLTYMIAVSESTPGPIMVNLATYVGSSQAGLPGSAIATLALLKTALKNRYVQAILRGLKPCIIGIILATGCFMIMNNCISITTGAALNGRALVISLILALVYFGSRKVLKKGLSPIMLIVISACLGMAMYGV